MRGKCFRKGFLRSFLPELSHILCMLKDQPGPDLEGSVLKNDAEVGQDHLFIGHTSLWRAPKTPRGSQACVWAEPRQAGVPSVLYIQDASFI